MYELTYLAFKTDSTRTSQPSSLARKSARESVALFARAVAPLTHRLRLKRRNPTAGKTSEPSAIRQRRIRSLPQA